MEYTVQNSSQFVRLINNFQCFSDEYLVSFDVVSLFTSISVHETLSIISNLLMSDNLLHERTNLTASDVIKYVELRLHSTVFSFNGTLYRQICGSPMGSCISPVVANIFMEHIERQALTTFREPPRIWLRYIDDAFCIIKSSVIDDFYHHVNSIFPILSSHWNWRITAIKRFWMFVSTVLLIANSGPQFITNPPTPTVIYNSTPTTPYIISWLLLKPCITESTPTFKNDLNPNLILISPKKH